MSDVKTEALDLLVSALERRTRGVLPRQFANMVSPAMADAFVKAWAALDRNPHDIPAEWQEMADSYAEMD
jgi:hypothetical protein